MKKTITLIFSGAILVLALTSSKTNVTNAQGDKTGSPLSSNQDCATSGCHSPSAARPVASIVVTNSSGQPVTSYSPSTTYTVTITSATTNGQSHFGLQSCALTASNKQAGTMSLPTTGSKIATRNGIQYLEHVNPIANTGGAAQAHFLWTSPTNVAEAVTIYAIVNHVNNNNSTSGDLPSNRASVTLTPSLNVAAIDGIAGISVYPNPATSYININMQSLRANTADIRITDLTGKIVFAETMNISANKTATIPTSNLAKGVYSLHITAGDEKGARLFSVN